MPKVGAIAKLKKSAQYDVDSYKREKQPMRTLANRRARHRLRQALSREQSRT